MEDCKYCEAIKNKENVLYEDDVIAAIIPERPCTKGHIQVISKKHNQNIEEIDEKEFQHLVYASSFSATALFENLGAQGTNLIMNTGSIIKPQGHMHMDVIARNPDDGLNFMWAPKKASEEELKSVVSKIKDKTDIIGVEKKEKKVLDLDQKKVEKIGEEKRDEKKGTVDSGAETEGGKEYKKNYESDASKKDIEECKESYLIRQLRRIP